MGQLWGRSTSVEFHNATPADGALAYFYIAGTSTPLAVYQDGEETTPHEDPVEADGDGRWPAVFVPFITAYKFVLKTSGGTTIATVDNVPNPNPIEASEDSVEDSEKISTGQIIFEPASGTRAGYVRCNGRTIGSASSGATERANADTQPLYEYNWNNFADAILPVTGGRGASAAADFAANKPMALLDGRSGTLRGVDDMGNSAASLLGSSPFTTGNATTGGSVTGANTHTLTQAQLPVITPAGSVSAPTFTGTGTTITATGSVSINDTRAWGFTADVRIGDGGGPPNTGIGTGSGNIAVGATSGAITGSFAGDPVSHTPAGTNSTPTFTGTSFGSGSAHNVVSKSILGTFQQKL